MSYLSAPRIHFLGNFQADTSTVNNDVRHFDNAAFEPNYQLPQSGSDMNGWWNPDGTGAFRLLDCAITGAVGTAGPSVGDAAIGARISGSLNQVSGKIVDLDPQQQGASQLWGLDVDLLDASGEPIFTSHFKPAAFIDLWRRQQGAAGGDQTLAATWQSQLDDVVWHQDANSPVLAALRAQTEAGLLSIRFNTFGYSMDTTKSDFSIGQVSGTIGPVIGAEPARFVLGRQMMPALGGNPVSAPNNVYFFQCVVDDDSVTADFGHALPIADGAGTPADLGSLHLGVLVSGTVEEGDLLGPDRFADLGEVAYKDENFRNNAGVQQFPIVANSPAADAITDHPLVVAAASGDQFKVLIQESIDGLYARADGFVFRLDAGESAELSFYASRYGKGIETTIDLAATQGMLGGGTGPQVIPPMPPPQVNTPPGIVTFPTSVQTDTAGHGVAQLSASADGPGNPRGYIDGQLYGVGYQLASQPAGYHANPWNFISVLAFDRYDMPATPTWHTDIAPIMTQYANLYPIMSKFLFNLADYDAVVENRRILQLAFGLPVSDPNYMPVTRDLSTAKRNVLLAWLGADGIPPKGDAPFGLAEDVVRGPTRVPDDFERVTDPLGGKTNFLASLPQIDGIEE